MEGADVFLGLSAGGVLKPEMVKGMAHEAADSRARQPDARNPAGTRARSAPGRRARHRPHRLSESGQQRSLLPVHFPRRARCGRDHRHARDGNRRRERDRGTGASGTKRYRRDGLWHPGFVVRSGVPDSEAVRSAPDREDRAGRREGRDGFRRRDPSDRGHGSLRAASAAVRLPQRHDDEAGVPARAQRRAGEEAHRVRGRRGRARAARGADRRRREDRASDPDRPAGGHRAAPAQVRPAAHARRGLHASSTPITTSVTATSGRPITR